MKKTLLTAILGLGMAFMASAETYTITMSECEIPAQAATISWSKDGFAFTANKNSGSTAPTYNAKGEDLRVYAAGSLTIAAAGANITGIDFAISSQGKKRLAPLEASSGTVAEITNAADNVVWSGNAADVTFTVGEKSEFGTDGASKAGQFDISSVTITTDGPVDAGSTPDVPTPEVTVVEDLTDFTVLPKGTEFEMGIDLTVVYYSGAYLYLTDGTTTTLAYYRAGGLDLKPGDVIAKGWKGTTDNYSGMLQVVPAEALTATSTGAEVPAPVEITADNLASVFTASNVAAYVKLVGVTFETETKASGSYKGTMGDATVDFYNRFKNDVMAPGVYDITGFIAVYNTTVQLYPISFEGGSVVELPVLESLTTLSDLENGTAFTMGMDLTVIYSNGAYTYVNDGISNALIYKYDLGLNAGDVIAKGWDASLSIYNGLNEIVPAADLTVASTSATLPEPTLIDEEPSWAVAAYNQAAYLKLVNVVFTDATPESNKAFTGTMGEETVNFYNRFKLESVQAGTYDVVGFVAVNYEKAQLYPISITPGTTSSISDINAVAAPAKYYNLQGIEVANPEAGNVYIRVEGNKATKVIR